jgi:cyclohexanecarboxyl-CoA dehydrogenase
MLCFEFSEEQELFRRSVREFAQKEVAPGYLERSKNDDFPWELYRMLGRAGFLGLMVDPEYDGQGADAVSAGIALEELGKADTVAAMLAFFTGAGFFIMDASSSIREDVLPRICRGEAVTAWGITEPEAGSDVSSIRMRARREGDEWILNGEKTSVSLISVAEAVVVLAYLESDSEKRGMGVFYIPVASPGVAVSTFTDMGARPIGRGSVTLDDVHVPLENIVGAEGEGFQATMQQFDLARSQVAMIACSIAEVCHAEALQYARERFAFGRPIGKFEGVAFGLVEDATMLEAAKLMLYRTFWLHDRGVRHTKESAMCKWWIPHLAVDVIHRSLLIHGHYGYSDELPVQQRLRDAIGLEIGDGTAEIMKVILTRELLGKECMPF